MRRGTWMTPADSQVQMPKQITDIKQFLQIVNRKDTLVVKVKKNKNNMKFKARTPKHLITLVVEDKAKAEKLIKMFPPSVKPEYID